MALKAEGIWDCTVLGGKAGETDKGAPNVQINVQIDSGPSAGVRCTYEDQVNGKSALYVSRSCKAVGWKGQTLATLEADIAAWIAATGGKSTVEIKHIEIKNGKRAGEIWDKPNSIGRGPQVLRTMSAQNQADADEAMRRALADDGGAPEDEQVGEDGLPFATCSMFDRTAIAKVLR